MTVFSAAGDRAARINLTQFLRVLFLVEIFSGIIQTYFIPIYAQMATKFHVGIGTLSWSLTVFTLSSAVVTPLMTKLGDTWGHRRALKIDVGITALGCVLVAAAPNFATLVVGRFLEGGIYGFLPLMFGLINRRYSHDDTRRGISYLTSVLVFGALAGTMITGVIVRYGNGPDLAMWLPAVGTSAAFAWLMLTGRETTPPGRPRIDWLGAVLLIAGLLLVLLGVSEGTTWGWSSGRVLACLIGGPGLLIAWGGVELKVDEPLADLRFLFRAQFISVYLVGFAAYFGLIGAQVAGSTFLAAPSKLLGYGLGLSAFQIAMLAPITIGSSMITVLFTARIGRAIGFRQTMSVGALLTALGFIGLAAWHTSLTDYLVLYGVAGAGAGLIEASTRTIMVDGLRPHEVATGEGMYELALGIGSSAGAAVLSVILASHPSRLSGVSAESGYSTAWLIVGLVCTAAAAFSIGYLILNRGTEAAAEPSIAVREAA